MPDEVKSWPFDVTAVLTHSGLGVVRSADRALCSDWLSRRGYAKLTIDCSGGRREVERQLGPYMKWEQRFGYELEEGGDNLDALRDGFDFDLGDATGFALELVEPETTWQLDSRWFEGLLAVAVEHARHQLALGHRFLVVLYVADSSPLVGRTVDHVTVPMHWMGALGAPANWSK